MADFATLVYDIDSSQAAGAAKALIQMERAAASAETGAARLDRTYRGANGQFIKTADVAKQNEAEIRRLAASYNTALSSQLAFADAERDVARAVQLGVVAADQQEAVLAGLAAQYSRTTAAANGYSAGMRQVNNVQASVGNQFAQLNDVVVTAWGGMNPALIGMQQGMQMVQGFAGQTLPQALTTLRGAFAQLLSPMTLLTVGAIAGGAALLQWGLAAFESEEKVKTLSDSVDNLRNSVSELQRINAVYSLDGPQSLLDKYGELNSEILLLIQRQREFATNEAMRAAAGLVSDTANELGRLGSEFQTALTIGGSRLQSFLHDMGLTFDQAIEVRNAINDVKGATDNLSRANALAKLTEAMRGTKLETSEVYGLIISAQSELRVLYNESNKSGWFAAAQSGALGLLGTVREIIAANTEALRPQQTTGDLGWATGANGFLLPGGELLPPVARESSSRGGGSGGGGGVDALRDEQKRRWEALNEGFKAESALTMAQYAQDQETLKWALDQKLITEQMYHQRRQELQITAWGTETQRDLLRYQTELTALDTAFSQKLIAEEAYLMQRRALQDAYYSGAINTDQNATAQQLSQMAGAFGQMNSLAGSGYSSLLKAQQTFAAGSALINAYLAATQALADPRVGFWGKAAAYAKTLAAGLGAVNAIKGGGSGGGGRGSSAAAAATRTEPQRQVLVRLQGDDWLVGMAETIMDEIYRQSADGRVIVVRDN